MSQSNISHPVSSAEDAPQKQQVQDQSKRVKRMSFGGGNDGHGSPMFKSLETARARRMSDGYDDQKPPAGFISAAFKRLVGAKTVADGK